MILNDTVTARMSMALDRCCLTVSLAIILNDTVADPLGAHVHGFGSVMFDCVVGDAAGISIVS